MKRTRLDLVPPPAGRAVLPRASGGAQQRLRGRTLRQRLALLSVWPLALPAVGAGLAGSPHDLVQSSAGSAYHVCEYCHVPDRSSTPAASMPAWARSANVDFPVYGAAHGAPAEDGGPGMWAGAETRLCLSCHDAMSASPVLHGGDRRGLAASQPSDGRQGHPVLASYPKGARAAGLHLLPASGDSTAGQQQAVRLVGGLVECTSCHNVHDPTFKPFLRRSNAGSAMCLACHKR